MDLPGYIPRRMAWQVPGNIPGLPPEAARVIQQALQGVYNELSRQGQVRNVIPLVEDLFVRPGSVVVGVADGQTITLLPPGATGYTDPVTVILTDVVDPVTVVRPDGTQDSLGGPGSYEYEPAGNDGYETSPGSAILGGSIPTDRLLGRDSAGTGAVEFISVGPGLKFLGTKAVDVRFPGAPIYDVMAPPFNAVGDGVADDTAAINAAIVAANATSGWIYLGFAHKVTSALTPVTGQDIFIIGRGSRSGGTRIFPTGATPFNVFTFSLSRACGMKDLIVVGPGTWASEGYALVIDQCFLTRIIECELNGTYGAAHIFGSVITEFVRSYASAILGPHAFYAHGSAAVGENHALTFNACACGTDVTSGTIAWYHQGSYCHTFELINCGALTGGYGLLVEDDDPGVASEPKFTRTVNFQADHCALNGIRLLGGAAARFTHTFITSISGGNAVHIASTYGGNWEFNGGEISGIGGHGIYVGKGDGTVIGVQIGNLIAGKDGIFVDTGVLDFNLIGNSCGDMYEADSIFRYGISIASGCDNYVVTGNRCIGNTTGAILNTPGVSSTRIVRNNIPETTTGIIPDGDYGDITVSGSGTVWTWDGIPVSANGAGALPWKSFDIDDGTAIDFVFANNGGGQLNITANWLGIPVTANGGAGTPWTSFDIDDTATIDFSFANNGGGQLNISAAVVAGSIGATQLGTNAVTTIKITDANVTLAKQADMAQSRIQGRAEGAGTGVPQALTPTQVVAIIDAESPTWSASHRFDSFIQFGTSTGLPASGDIRKAGAILISTADDLNLTALDNSTITVSNTLAMSGGAAVTVTSSNTIAITATTTLTLTAGTSVSVPSFLSVAGAAEFSGALTVRASQRWSTVATATLAATTSNFAAGAATVCKFTLTGNQTLTGIVPDSTSEGCLMLVVNADTVDNLTLAHDQVSTAANRFLLPGSTDRVLLPNAMALLWYDFNSSRWRMVYGV